MPRTRRMSVQPASVMGHSKDATGTRPRQGTRACPDRVPDGTHAEPIEVPTKTRTRHTGGHTSRAVSHVCPARARPGRNRDAHGSASAGKIRVGCALNLELVRCRQVEPRRAPATAADQGRRPFEPSHQRHPVRLSRRPNMEASLGPSDVPRARWFGSGISLFCPAADGIQRVQTSDREVVHQQHPRQVGTSLQQVCDPVAQTCLDRCEILATQRRSNRGSPCWSSGVDGDAYRYTRCRSWSRHRCS